VTPLRGVTGTVLLAGLAGVVIVGMYSLGLELRDGRWHVALGTLFVLVVLAIIASAVRLWMIGGFVSINAYPRPSRGLGDEPEDDEDLEQMASTLDHFLSHMPAPRRRALLVERLDAASLAAATLDLATGIGIIHYVSSRAARNGILHHVSAAMRDALDNPDLAGAFGEDEVAESVVSVEADGEEALLEQLTHYLANTKEPRRAEVLAATFSEEMLAATIVEFADGQALRELLERAGEQ
jgi:hypothetical protein